MYLAQHNTPFDLVAHPHSVSSLHSAHKAKVLPSRVAKAVLLEDDLEHSHFTMAVVPATHHVELAKLALQTGRAMHLATEEDAAGLFEDCETGAIPPLGPAYGVETIVDESLMAEPELYFEAGDHEHLVHLQAQDLLRLLADCPRGLFSRPM
jgi:Ala-tRNA(Pro) deacylase